MAAATILHVGNDNCHRIPVMENAGLAVVKCEPSVSSVEKAFAGTTAFSGIAFHNQIAASLGTLASTARRLSTAPLILFRNTFADCDEHLFDLVIPVQTPPPVWLKSLEAAISVSCHLQQESELLCQDAAKVRSISQGLQRYSRRLRQTPFDPGALWRDESE